jgi:antirestriction protein ArdC
MATTNSTIEKIAPMFTDLLIKKIECLKTDWQKPWIASLEQGLPRNIRGTLYNGGNVLMLLFYTEFMKFTLPVFLTFNQAKEEDLSISKGARSFPVYYWFKFVVHKETKKTIKYEEYRKLPATEQENYKVIPQMKYYNVFNIDQTDFAGKYPERYERMKKGEQPEDYSDGMIYEALDELVCLQNWYCPIKVQYSDSAYYSPSSDHIVCPQREQFPQGAEYYGTLLHEMAHSTGSPQRLNRTFGSFFGDALYAREELVAELTAALRLRSRTAGEQRRLSETLAHQAKGRTRLFGGDIGGREQGGEDDCRQGNRTDERTRSSLNGTTKEQEYQPTGGAIRPLKHIKS